MKANGEEIKTIQELLRHSNYKVTADVYIQAMTSEARGAKQSRQDDSARQGRQKGGLNRAFFPYRTLSNPRTKGSIPLTVTRVSHWFECAVKRRWSTAGASPARELVRSAR